MPLQKYEDSTPTSIVKGIDIEKIEADLASLWTEKGTTPGPDEPSSVTRACTQNLLVYTTNTQNRSTLDDILDEVTEQHPGRTLILVANRESQEAALEAYVSTRCRLLDATTRQICGEQVTIDAGGSAVNTVASAIAPLLVPDVPVFLWWNDAPRYEDGLFGQLVSMSDRVVIDSASFDHPYRDLLGLAQLIRGQACQARMSDLNWGRLTSWRALMASFWDIPDYRPHLEKIDRVDVEYSQSTATATEIAPKALLVAAWFASRLGWTLDHSSSAETTGASFAFRSGSGGVEVSLRAVVEGADAGMLNSVTLAGPTDAQFVVTMSSDKAKLETSAITGAQRSISRVLAYREKSKGQCLGRELSILGCDPVYEAAVEVAVQMIHSIQ
jgi:glucose-6-phosphate dehydrogenase assembly protein OpcA